MLDWNKRPWSSAIVAVGLVYTLFFVASLLIPITPDLCHYDPSGNPENCAQHHLGPWTFLWIVFFTDIHNGAIIAIATLGLVYVTYLLVKLGKEQAGITQAQIRAAISIESIALMDGPPPPGAIPQAPGGCPVSRVSIQNSGDTSAHSVRHFSEIIFAQISQDGRVLGSVLNYPTDMTPIAATTIAKAGKTIITRSLGRVLTVPELAQLGAQPHGHALIIYGRISYNDAFGRDHRTDYCFGYAGQWPPPADFVLTFMTNGNYSD